ncbi:MAG: ATP-dependent DNA helicase RecG [Tenericutes bacterium]|nr:ATP-dependent DNA helicase RecG [Mycoplasmatota bacterium]
MGRLIDIKGIGPKTVQKLNRLNIKTTNDLLFSFPSKYETHKINDFSSKELDKELTLVAKVYKKPRIFFIRRNLDKLSVQVEIDKVIFYVHIFNRRFLSKSLIPDTEIVITGRFLKNFASFTASNIVLKKNYKLGIIPIYGFKEIKESTSNKIIKQILSFDYSISETLPGWALDKHKIPNINSLIDIIHNPKTEEDIYISKKRIIYEELLNFAVKIQALKKLNKSIITINKKYDITIVKDFIKTLPFVLTKDQQLATNDIFKDLKSNQQMNRLLQGDVGSGKTIVSIIASLAVVTAKFQVAIMAPTLVLAKQHFATFSKYLSSYGIRIGLLTSEMKISEKNAVAEAIRNNQIDIIIGTHSLIQESIDFHNLGFAVIDEQHRFGVKQRRELRLKGATPDILLMSATPIPRTLAISIYQDIDLSFIKEKPVGRLPISTDVVAYEDLDLLLENIKTELDKNHQAYFICPKILNSETSTKISVNELYNILNTELGNQYKIGVLHGKMIEPEKTSVLDKFYNNEIDILISTTVVEVGVNIKNATVMVILSADSFGLAQLHQLRGRIGRDSFQSYCYLVVDDILEAKDRLKILKETNDGFLISEYDLTIRGPGEVFGSIQSGIPIFKMANLINDQEILAQAFEDATIIMDALDVQSKRLRNKAIKSIESYNLD